MALIDCPECSKQISDQAAACPHCGHPIKSDDPEEPQPQQREGLFLQSMNIGCAVVIGFVIVLIFLFIFTR